MNKCIKYSIFCTFSDINIKQYDICTLFKIIGFLGIKFNKYNYSKFRLLSINIMSICSKTTFYFNFIFIFLSYAIF